MNTKTPTNNTFKVLLHIDSTETDARVEIYAPAYSEQIRLIEQVAQATPEITQILGFSPAGHKLLPVEQIALFFTQQKRVCVRAQGEVFQIRQRLFELEERLNPKHFIRISQSEIVNLRFVQSLDFSIAGTISLKLKDGTTTFVSRRCLKNFKQQLGI